MPADAAWDESRDVLESHGLDPTLNRVLVLAAMAASDHPLSAREVHDRVMAEHRLNRVTVYRILDLFAHHGVVSRISAGERGFRYCARPDRRPWGHVHFHCTRCGQVQCITNRAVDVGERLADSLPMDIRNVELRLDGICDNCKNAGR